MQNNLFLNDFERSRRKNNVAVSCAYLVSVCLYVVNGGGFWDPDTEAVLTRAFNDNLANSLQFVTMDPRIKQAWYENNVITAGWINAWSTGQNSAQDQQVARQMAQGVLTSFGIAPP